MSNRIYETLSPDAILKRWPVISTENRRVLEECRKLGLLVRCGVLRTPVGTYLTSCAMVPEGTEKEVSS